MATIPSQFSAAFTNKVFGLITGTNTATAVSFPDEPVGMVNIQTYADNKESFFIGVENYVLWELEPGKETGWFVLGNLNEFQFYSISGSAERLAYWIFR